MKKLDNVDLQILQELSKDARQPFSKIAKKIGLSIQTITKRYNQMKENSTIKRCSICVDLKKIGYTGTAHLLINCVPEGNLSRAIEQIRKKQNIIIATKTMGDHEGYAVLLFKDIVDLNQRVVNIKKLPDIDNVEFSISLFISRCFPRSQHPFHTSTNQFTI